MKITVSEPLPLGAEEVFHLLRDDMPSLVPYLYDIERIEVTDRSEDGDEVHIVNLWFGDMSKVPRAIRKFVKPDLFSWKDHATWSTATRAATWRLEPRVGARAFECSGTTSVEVDGDTSKLNMDIDLLIHPENVPGIPSFLARKFRPQIEAAIEKQIAPNMRNLAVSIRRFAEAKPTG